MDKGKEFTLVCPGSRIVAGHKRFSESSVKATCFDGTQVHINGSLYEWNQTSCAEGTHATVRFTGDPCNGGSKIEIGFKIDNSTFIRQILVCFDTKERVAIYTYHVLKILARPTALLINRPQFEEDQDLYNTNRTKNSEQMYKRNNQRESINYLAGIRKNSEEYIQKGDFYLSKGHLSPPVDFLYTVEKNTTFQYINAVPQWQTFNAFNWKAIEESITNYTYENNLTLQIWTGTYRIMNLKNNTTKESVDLYLFKNNTAALIPVPALLWKLVYHEKSKKGIVLLGINNPYQKNVTQYIICPDISNKIKWLRWNPKNITEGYSYCCTIQDFQKVYDKLPKFNVSDLLL